MANTYLTRTFSTPTNRKIWTWSAWVKRQNLVSNYANAMFGAYYDGNNRSVIRFDTHELNFQDSANSVEIKTNRLFRDISAWYHIVAAVDTTQGTASDRIRLYVNGEQQTSFRQADYPAQNDNMQFNGADPHYINGRNSSGSVDSIADMSYSHVHFCDGTALAPTVFGETDATTGEWKIKTDPSFTLGTNGFTILKDGNTITDQSSNSNNWSLGAGTVTNTEDSPSNVFATLNPLQSQIGGATLSLGNTKLVTGNGNPLTGTTVATLGVSSGKFYWETKLLSAVSSTYPVFSIVGENCVVSSYLTSTLVGDYVTYTPSNGNSNEIYERYNDGSIENNYSYGDGSTINVNDIIGCALDKDNGKVYWSINGTWVNSGDPVNGTNPASSNVNNLRGDFVFPAYGDENYLSSAIFETNFGNGYFGTTAVSTAGTNASGNGIFEYDVPTGFTALSTKGLNL